MKQTVVAAIACTLITVGSSWAQKPKLPIEWRKHREFEVLTGSATRIEVSPDGEPLP